MSAHRLSLNEETILQILYDSPCTVQTLSDVTRLTPGAVRVAIQRIRRYLVPRRNVTILSRPHGRTAYNREYVLRSVGAR